MPHRLCSCVIAVPILTPIPKFIFDPKMQVPLYGNDERIGNWSPHKMVEEVVNELIDDVLNGVVVPEGGVTLPVQENVSISRIPPANVATGEDESPSLPQALAEPKDDTADNSLVDGTTTTTTTTTTTATTTSEGPDDVPAGQGVESNMGHEECKSNMSPTTATPRGSSRPPIPLNLVQHLQEKRSKLKPTIVEKKANGDEGGAATAADDKQPKSPYLSELAGKLAARKAITDAAPAEQPAPAGPTPSPPSSPNTPPTSGNPVLVAVANSDPVELILKRAQSTHGGEGDGASDSDDDDWMSK